MIKSALQQLHGTNAGADASHCTVAAVWLSLLLI
jgi:hypothetical protein